MQDQTSIKLPARLQSLPEFLDFVSVQASIYGFTKSRIKEIELAAEEALVNIFNYAYQGGTGDVEVACTQKKDSFIIEIVDSGIPFDMTGVKDPNLTADISERKIGGLGIYLIRQMMDNIEYSREENRNILRIMVKKR